MARTKDLYKGNAGRKAAPRGGKRWLAIWIDPDGKEKSKAFTTQEAAKKYASAQEVDVARGVYISPEDLRTTVNGWCDTWEASHAGQRKTTVATSRSHLARIRAEFGAMYLTQVRQSQVKAWIVKLQAEGLEASYINVLHGRLAQIMTDAVADGLLTRSPCSRKTAPPAGKQRPYVITTKQMWALADAMPGELRIAVLLGAFAGLRLREACGLREQDIDLITGLVHPAVQWPADPLKTEASQTAVPVPAAMCAELLAHMVTGSGATVLGVSPWMLERAIRAARPKVPGLPENFRYHDLRHYFASMLIASGCDVKTVQARLRHSSARTTLDVYSHLWPDSDTSTRAAGEAIFAARTEQGRNKTGDDQGTGR